ncbi:Uncharacterised protein [Candidatus Gugararchaeum adminiculabundum]|nr:Uncharacterised protein [Candidatus Gugararchaeum adminiculabundum]
MKRLLLLLLLAGFASAKPVCPSYPYGDFVWESDYKPPGAPPDTLLDECPKTGVDQAICAAASNQSLTIQERKQLVLDGLTENASFPDFDAARKWNEKLAFSKYAPDGVQTKSSVNIRDAWLKISSIEPSVYAKNGSELLINSSSVIHSSYNSTLVIKKEVFSEDCKTEYEVCGYKYSLQEKLTETKASSNLKIDSEYFIHHWHEVVVCYGTDSGTVCFTVCEYYKSEDKKDSLTLSDESNVSLKSEDVAAFSFIESFEHGLAEGWLVFVSTENFNHAIFTLDNSQVKLEQNSYQLSANLSPYNPITPEALDSPVDFESHELSVYSRNTLKANGSALLAYLKENDSAVLDRLNEQGFAIKDSEIYRYEKVHFLVPVKELNCSLDFYGHFSYTHEDNFCIFTNEDPVLNLSLANRTNESITVNVSFYENNSGIGYPDKLIQLKYANQTINVTTDENGEALAVFSYFQYSSLVSAEFDTDFKTKSASAKLVIPFDPSQLWGDFFSILSLILVFYLLYKLSRRLVQ